MNNPVIIDVESTVEPCAGDGVRLDKLTPQPKKPHAEKSAEAAVEKSAEVIIRCLLQMGRLRW